METHPEYFALQADGTRHPFMVNLSNPDVPKLVAEKIRAEIRERRKTDPNFNSLGFAPDDGLPMDLSPETRKLSAGFPDLVGREGVVSELSVSEEWFAFVNKVTEAGVSGNLTKARLDFFPLKNLLKSRAASTARSC